MTAKTISAEASLKERWESFVDICQEVREAWPLVVEAAIELDALDSGGPPIRPLPRDLGTAFERALTAPGQTPFYDSPRLTTRRLDTSGSLRAVDGTGYARTLNHLGLRAGDR